MRPERTPVPSLRRRRSLQLFGALGSAAVVVLTGPIYAQTTRNWDAGASTGNWTDAANWSNDTLPGITDTAAFNAQTGQQTITLGPTAIEISTLTFSANTSTLYRLQSGSLIVNTINQTADDANEAVPSVTFSTKNSGADVLNVNVTSNTFQMQGKLTSGGLVKTGTGGFRLGTSGTDFNNAINGNIVINGGTLNASGGTDSAKNPLGGTGNVTIGAGGVTLSLTHSNLAAAGNANTFDFARDIVANNNSFTLNVDRAAGFANAGVSQAGMLTMGNATLTVAGNNGFSARLDGLTVNSGATTALNINSGNAGGQPLRLDSLIGDATTTIRKDGGQTLFISAANNSNFLGTIALNGGTTLIEATSALNPTQNAAGYTFLSASTLSFRSDNDNIDFASPITIAPNVFSQITINVDRISSAGESGKTISFSGVSLTGGKNLTITSGNTFGAAMDFITVDAGSTGTLTTNLNNNAVVTTPVLNLGAGSTFNKIGGTGLTITGNNSATASGAINVRAGTLTGTVAGAFGTGLITVGNTTPNSAGFLADTPRVNWNAQGASANASGVDAVAVAGGVIDLNVDPAATDVFDIKAEGRIQGNTSQLQALTVGSNLFLAPNAIVVHEAPSDAAGTSVVGLTNDANLFYGLGGNASTLPTIGVGTPWKGISGDTSGRTIQGVNASTPTVININGGDNNAETIEATLQAMSDQALNFGTSAAGDGSYTWNSTVAGQKVTLAVRGVIGSTTLGNVPGGRVLFLDNAATTGLASAVDKIVVQNGALGLIANNALGGVPVEVQNNGTLDIGGSAGVIIDGNVTIKSGGVLFLNDNQVLGDATATNEGTITIEGGGKLDISGSAPANILTQSAANGQPINFTGAGHTVRFAASNIGNLDATVPNAGVTYVVAGGATAATVADTNISATMNTQDSGITLENGILTNDGSTRAFTGPINLNNTNLTLAATRGTDLVITSAIATTGDVNIGSLTPIDNRDKSLNSSAVNWAGVADPYNSQTRVVLLGDFSANNVTVNNTHVAFGDADTSITNDLTVNGSVLYLDGGGPINANQGQLTTRLVDGNLAKRIILGPNTRAEVKLNLASDSNATALQINQPFVINGEVNPLDKRTFWLSRQSGTNTRVDLNDVTLNAGAAFGVQEDNTNVQVALKLAGNATSITPSSNTPIDYKSISRDASLPAFDGTNPVVLTQGRVVTTAGTQGESSSVSSVFGTIGAGVQVDLVRGQLLFTPGSALNGVVRTQTAAAGGDSFVLSTSNSSTSDTSIGGTGRIELGRSAAANGPEDFEIRGTEVPTATTTAPLHTHTGEIRIVNDGNASTVDGIVRSNRANDSDRAARVKVDNVVLESGSTVQFASSNSIPLTVASVTLQGNGTIDTVSAGMTINAINAGTNTLNFTGTTAPTLTGAVTAGQVNVNNLTMSFPSDLTGGLAVNGGSTTAAGNVAGALNVTAGTATLAGNVVGAVNVSSGGVATFNAGTGLTKTIGGPVTMDGSGTLSVGSGTVDLGTNLITASSPGGTVAGLREQKITGSAFDVTTANTSNIVKLGPVMAQTTSGWGTNETYVYTGQFFVPDNNGDGTGTFAFAENFDDSVRITINGTQRLNNSTFNDATGTGALSLPSGWYDIEIRLGQGTGGAGPVASDGWNTTLGLGVDLDKSNEIDNSTGSPVQAQYVAPLDNGAMNLFRTVTNSGVNIAANATLKAGGFSNVGRVNFNGANATARIEASGAAQSSSASAIVVAASASGTLNVVRAGDTVTAGALNLAGAFTKTGDGTLVVTGEGTGAGAIAVEDGQLVMDGSVSGAVTVAAGATISGGGVTGALTLNGGTISPGNSPGILTASSLTLNGGNIAFELNGTTAGTGYDQINATTSVSLTANTSFSMTLGFVPAVDSTFTLINNGGSEAINTGTFRLSYGGTTLNEGDLFSTPDGAQFRLSYQGGTGNDIVVTTTIPEPGSVASLIGGLGMLLGMQRIRRRRK